MHGTIKQTKLIYFPVEIEHILYIKHARNPEQTLNFLTSEYPGIYIIEWIFPQ